MLKIRFQRRGAKKRPYYRLVVMPSTYALNSQVIEDLGSYNPFDTENEFQADGARVQYWMQRGAQASTTALSFLQKNKMIEISRKPNKKRKKRKSSKKSATLVS